MAGIQEMGRQPGAQHHQFDHAGPQGIRQGCPRRQGPDRSPDILFQTASQGSPNLQELRRLQVGELEGQIRAGQPRLAAQALFDASSSPGPRLAPTCPAGCPTGRSAAGAAGDGALREGDHAPALEQDQESSESFRQDGILDFSDSRLDALQGVRVQLDAFPGIGFFSLGVGVGVDRPEVPRPAAHPKQGRAAHDRVQAAQDLLLPEQDLLGPGGARADQFQGVSSDLGRGDLPGQSRSHGFQPRQQQAATAQALARLKGGRGLIQGFRKTLEHRPGFRHSGPRAFARRVPAGRREGPGVLLERLELVDFRNYGSLDLALEPGLLLLVGENAQGKTALLEALYLLGTSRSFRALREIEVLAWGSSTARVRARLRRDQGTARELEINWLRKGAGLERRILRNGVPLRRLTELLSEVPMTLFTPADLALVQGPPQGRRRFLDLLLCKISPVYLAALTRFASVLRQRNELLRRRPSPSSEELAPWDEQLAGSAAILVPRRQEAVGRLQGAVAAAFANLSDSRSDLRVEYRPGAPSTSEGFLAALDARRREEMARGSTQVGPHRDDLELLLDGRSLQRFGSQGQHRSAALALRLAQAMVMSEALEERALVLLDDCLSELDVGRGQRLLEILSGFAQVFLTTTTLPQALPSGARILRVVSGTILKD